MNREYNCKVSSKNSKRLLKNLQNTAGGYFLPNLYTHIIIGIIWYAMHIIAVCCMHSTCARKYRHSNVLYWLPCMYYVQEWCKIVYTVCNVGRLQTLCSRAQNVV